MRTVLAIILAGNVLAACAFGGQQEVERVRIYKSDGSRQCESGGISPETMKTELQGIRVYTAKKQVLHGVMFPAVCGGKTGNINVYTIAAKDQAEAQKRGFFVFPKPKKSNRISY